MDWEAPGGTGGRLVFTRTFNKFDDVCTRTQHTHTDLACFVAGMKWGEGGEGRGPRAAETRRRHSHTE